MNLPRVAREVGAQKPVAGVAGPQPSHAAQASELRLLNVTPLRLSGSRESDLAVAINAKDCDGPPRALRHTLKHYRCQALPFCFRVS